MFPLLFVEKVGCINISIIMDRVRMTYSVDDIVEVNTIAMLAYGILISNNS